MKEPTWGALPEEHSFRPSSANSGQQIPQPWKERLPFTQSFMALQAWESRSTRSWASRKAFIPALSDGTKLLWTLNKIIKLSSQISSHIGRGKLLVCSRLRVLVLSDSPRLWSAQFKLWLLHPRKQISSSHHNPLLFKGWYRNYAYGAQG